LEEKKENVVVPAKTKCWILSMSKLKVTQVFLLQLTTLGLMTKAVSLTKA